MKRVIPPRLVIYPLIGIALLAAIGWIKPYLAGPELSSMVTMVRVKPVPVPTETVKWLTKVDKRIVRDTVTIPVEVIREVPAKQAERLHQDFNITLPELRETNRELANVVEVPPAPRGGEMAITVNTESGAIGGIFRAKPSPLIEFGGLREAGVEFDAMNTIATGYYKQDLIRIGPAVVNGRVYASLPGGARSPAAGAAIGVAVRF
jgi:hypothetical protein